MAGKAPGADEVPEEEALRDLRTDMFVYVKFPWENQGIRGDSATFGTQGIRGAGRCSREIAWYLIPDGSGRKQ